MDQEYTSKFFVKFNKFINLLNARVASKTKIVGVEIARLVTVPADPFSEGRVHSAQSGLAEKLPPFTIALNQN